MDKGKASVIGASGLVGQSLRRVLEGSGYEVAGTYWKRPGDGLDQLDITDFSTVARWFQSVRPVVVYLTAALTGVDYCEDHPDEAYRVNTEGTRFIAETAAKNKARFVYYSTDYVFNGEDGPYGEDAVKTPLSIYGKTKAAAEEVIQETLNDFLIIRTTVVYGWDRASKNFAMQVYQRLGSGSTMEVPEDQWGNPTLVDYLAEASVRLVQEEVKGIIHVVGDECMPRTEFARALARAYDLDPQLIRPVPTSSLHQRALRPLRGGLRTDRLQRILGTEAMSLDESLKRLRRHTRADTHTKHVKSERTGEAVRLSAEIFDRVRDYYGLVHKGKSFVPFKSQVPYSGRVFDEREMLNLVDSALDFWLTLGPYGDLFERKMKGYFRVRDFVLVNSGSSANLVALATLKSPELGDPLKEGDEVITPAVTFPTTLAPIVMGGLVPIFVDCEVDTCNINPYLIEAAISPRTRAIMVPHTLGNPCDMEIICDIAQRYGLFLVEDACDALGSTFSGKLVGTFGDLGTLSFFPAHHITMGEGGGVIVNRARFVKIVRSVRDWGRDCWCAPGESNTCSRRFGWKMGGLPDGYDHKYIYSHVGYNLKPTDLQAAIGVAQAERIPEFIEKRRANFLKIYRALEPYQDFIVLPRWDSRSQPSWFGFPITVKGGVSRRELVQWLESARIETRSVFGGNILRQPGYADIRCRIPRDLAQSDRVMRDTFFIGVYPGLTHEMMDFMIERLETFFKKL